IGRELRLVTSVAGVSFGSSIVAVVDIGERRQRLLEGRFGLPEDPGRLDRYAAALALGLAGAVRRPGNTVTLRDQAHVGIGARACAHALSGRLALGGVNGTSKTKPKVCVAGRSFGHDRGLRWRDPWPAFVVVAVDDKREHPCRVLKVAAFVAAQVRAHGAAL